MGGPYRGKLVEFGETVLAHEMPKLKVLDDYEEMMKGRQKELNSLKEIGTMTVVKGLKQLARERFKHDG